MFATIKGEPPAIARFTSQWCAAVHREILLRGPAISKLLVYTNRSRPKAGYHEYGQGDRRRCLLIKIINNSLKPRRDSAVFKRNFADQITRSGASHVSGGKQFFTVSLGVQHLDAILEYQLSYQRN